MFLFDGAMGTRLQQCGLKNGECPEEYNVTHPAVVQQIHREYVEAGSDIILTNTFGANRIKLSHYKLADRVKEICEAAVRNARAAGNEKTKVAGDMGPTGQFIKPLGNLSFDEVYNVYYEQAKALDGAGVDYLIIETIIDIQEMRAALLAAKAASKKPVICQLSFSEDGRTITGTDPTTGAILLEAMGADVVGANCSLGPAQLLPIAREMAAATNLPITIQPNAGMPELIDGETVFPLSPTDLASYMQDLVDAGVTYIGGCCGTTAAHIAAMWEALDKAKPYIRPKVKPFTAITSRTKTVYIGPDYSPIQIGERINPTGRKVLREMISKGNFVMVKKDALAQIEAGADALDVNMGVPGIDQSIAMEKAISELAMLCKAPLCIDTMDPKALEAGLKVYPGRALVNSVNADPDQLATVLPLVKKYGAAVLCLPIGPAGIPATAMERVAVIEGIVAAAKKMGLREQDLLLDPLVLTVAAAEDGAWQTLETLKLYRKHFRFPTVMGLSNVSFGLPNRAIVNGAFLTMALVAGLDAPILNPLNEEMHKAVTLGRLLLGHDRGAKEYIKQYGEQILPVAVKGQAGNTDDPLEQIRQAVQQGEKELVVTLVTDAINDHIDPLQITKEGLTAAMTAVGDAYGAGRCYLPQVMLSAEAMQAAFQAIKRELPDLVTAKKGKIAIATVKGDIHDLGKNIVAALLENNGYGIVDMGKDVAPETIVEIADKEQVQVVGLCSLMTTTMPQIDIAIKQLRNVLPSIKIVVGGAVMTQDYADQAGADAYAKDGIAAVKLVKKLLGDNE